MDETCPLCTGGRGGERTLRAQQLVPLELGRRLRHVRTRRVPRVGEVREERERVARVERRRLCEERERAVELVLCKERERVAAPHAVRLGRDRRLRRAEVAQRKARLILLALEQRVHLQCRATATSGINRLHVE